MQDTGKADPKIRKKLVLSSHNRSAVVNEMSNFVTETRTVVVHKQQTVILDSPERANRNRGGVSAGGISLSSIGMRHMQKQKERQATVGPSVQQQITSERKPSQFLINNPPTTSGSKSFGIGSLGATSFSAGGPSRANSSSNSQPNPALVPSGGMSLSDKFRARLQQKQQQQSAASASINASTSSLSQLQRSLTNTSGSAGPGANTTTGTATSQDASSAQPTGTNIANYSESASVSAASSASDVARGRLEHPSVVSATTTSAAATTTSSAAGASYSVSAAAAGSNTSLGGLFMGTGRTMAIKR